MMLKGAVTVGTMDGATVEIVGEVGEDNAFIFGMSSDEVIEHERKNDYDPMSIYNNDAVIKKTVDRLIDGTFSKDKELFRPLWNSLLNTKDTSKADTYFILKDFHSYADAQARVREAYEDKSGWAKMAMLQTACCGKFSSDRTIEEYVKDIWHLDKIKV